MRTALKKAFFLDRDGVLIEEANYLKDPDKVKLIPGVPAALRRVREAGFLVIVVSNQSGVARGYFTENEVLAVQARINEILSVEGAAVDDYFNCPHHPAGSVPSYAKDCECRKPSPGMILEAAKKYGIDISASFLVGDKLSDIEAGKAAGCLKSVLVKTGHGLEELEKYGVPNPQELAIAADLPAAVEVLLSQS